MKAPLVSLALAGFLAGPLAAQSTTAKAQSSTAAQVDNKVSASLAASVKVSADSAMALAHAYAKGGEVSSAELELKEKRLVYEVKVLTKSKRASEVEIDAMSGEVIKNHEYGGLKATRTHHMENKKLLNAKRDSAAKTP